MNEALNRRTFLTRTTVAAAGAATLGQFQILRAGESPNQKLRVAVMGCTNRGMGHIEAWLNVPNVEIARVCDVDRRALEKGLAAAERKQGRKPKGDTDIRRVLDDPEVDVLSIAAPNHWHAPGAILACRAGKHVYVEKPGSHNPQEAEWIVAAARKYRRKVQMGNQRRSWSWIIEAIQRLHAGEIGPVRFARAWYYASRGSIGRGRVVPVPEWLDFDLWQGPAPERPYVDNLVHYNWHWRWHWGNGEIANNGVHFLDLARWGLQVGAPRRVTCGGGRYRYDDDWETPDTCALTVDFGDKGVVFESHSCHPHREAGGRTGVIFYGDTGTMVFADLTCRIYDREEKLLSEVKGQPADVPHFQNLADAIREGTPLRSEIEEGQKATMLCHLANIAWRTGRTIDVDPLTGRPNNNPDADALWRREYRPGWEPNV
jgi:predicted dehydrogenase